MSNPYSPKESSADLLAEKSWMQGALLSSVVYGAQFILFCLCLSLLWQHRARSSTKASRKITYFMLVYIIVLFSLGTIFQIGNAAFTQLVFITDRDFPGGPGGAENALFSVPVDDAGNVAFVISNWMCDALMIWRCAIIYSSSNRYWTCLTVGFPCLIFLGSISMGIPFLIQVSTTSVYIAKIVNWTIPYLSLSLALNILVTIFIVARLLLQRRRITRALGNLHGVHYTSIVAMIIESAALYSVFSLLLLVPFGLKSPISQIFLPCIGQVQICATFLILFRVAQGKGWTASTQASTVTQSFKAYPMSHLSGGQASRGIATSAGSRTVVQFHDSAASIKPPYGSCPEVSLSEHQAGLKNEAEDLKLDQVV